MIHYVINWLGFAVCHQIPARSFAYGAEILAICARDTGIYIGILAGFVTLTVMNRKHQNGFPPWWAIVIGVGAIGLMGLDGVSSYGGFRTTTNLIRLATGLGAGAAFPLALVPMFNYQAWKTSSEEKIIKTPIDLLVYAAVMGAMFLIFLTRPAWLYGPMYLITGFAIAFAFIYTNAILVMLLPWWAQKAERWRDLAVPLLIGAFLGFIELAGSAFMHSFLLSKITG